MSEPNSPAGEPAEEMGYWEKLAATSGQAPQSEIEFNPQSAVVLGGADPQPVDPSPPNAAWAPPPQQTPYGGYGGPHLPDHPKADLAFVFGMIAGPGAIV